MNFFVYYLAFWALQFLWGQEFNLPLLVVGAALVLAVQRWLPSPYLYFKHANKVRLLRAQIDQNPDNVTARRDLARIWIEKGRPRRALELLDQAAKREPDSVELAFLRGRALCDAGDPERALPSLIQVAQKDERFQYGEGYLLAGRALLALGRDAEAEDALLRHVRINSSSVEGWTRLAKARRRQRDGKGATEARREALATFEQLPRFRRRRERWWAWRARLGLG